MAGINRITLLLFIFIFFNSCDGVYRVEFINKTDYEIKFELKAPFSRYFNNFYHFDKHKSILFNGEIWRDISGYEGRLFILNNPFIIKPGLSQNVVLLFPGSSHIKLPDGNGFDLELDNIDSLIDKLFEEINIYFKIEDDQVLMYTKQDLRKATQTIKSNFWVLEFIIHQSNIEVKTSLKRTRTDNLLRQK
jgi:hypothetical protein